MPPLVRLYVRQVLIGFLLSVVFVSALLLLDVGGLGRLVAGSDMAAVATAMLVVFNGIVFAGAQFGIAVMRLSERPEPPTRGRPRGRRATELVPVRHR